MTESDTRPPDGDEALRRSLLKRVGVAAVLVVALLAALMLFDGQSGRDEQRAAPVARVEPPVRPIEKPAEPAAVDEAEEEAGETVAAVPEETETPISRPRADERPLTVPATARNAAMRPADPVAAAPKPPKPDVARDIARVLPPKEAATMPEASRPIARAVESARQFLVQVGVFGNLANAEELRARLENAGVPAHIEARVRVGPFASREEAERAREKMKEIGVAPGIIMTRK